MSARTVLQLVLMDETGDSFYRMRWPARELAAQEPSWRIINLDARAAERFNLAQTADLLVLFQSQDLSLLPILAERRRHGKKTLVEYNDNFYEPPPASPAAPHWASPLIWQNYETFIEQSDGLIVTGPGLEQLFSSITSKPIFVLENHFPDMLEPFDKLWCDSGSALNIGWGGSLGHISDLLALLPLLREVVVSNERLQLHIMGNTAIEELIRLPREQVRFTPWGSVQSYYQFWNPVHIGVAPMLDTAYNRCRSDIKAVEMAARGVLPLLPDAVPYRKFCRETGIAPYRSAEELKQKLQHYTADPAAARAAALDAYEYVNRARIGPLRRERLELYQRMMPEGPPEYNGDIPAGAHELLGTPETEQQHIKVLNAARMHLKAKRTQQALSEISASLELNPLNGDLAFTYLRLLSSTRPVEFRREIEKSVELFPRDLRMLALKAETLRDPSPLEALLQKLSELPALSREVFHPDIVRVVAVMLAENRITPDTAELFSNLYPSSAPLHMETGQAFERAGRYPEAFAHFAWLVEHEQVHALSKDFFNAAQRNYIYSWYEFLKNAAR